MDIARYRLHSQQLHGARFSTATELTAYLAAVQGQEYGPTKWGLGLRLPHLLDADIERALEAGNILRTHILRPTWHFVAAPDLRWMLGLSAPRVHQANGSQYRMHHIDEALIRHCQQLVVKHLHNENHLTRDELGEIFSRNGVADATKNRLAYIMMWLELDGVVCSGKRRGNQNTYALLDERAPAGPELSRAEALYELSRRYFRSRGPATARDFATWSGLTQADCKRGIEACGPELQADKIGAEMYYRHTDTAMPSEHSAAVHLLPIYDELIFGYKDRSCLFVLRDGLPEPPQHRFDNLVLINGQVAGTWRRDFHARSIDLVLELYQSPDAVTLAGIQQAAERFGAFHGLPAALHFFDPGSDDKKFRPGWAFSNK